MAEKSICSTELPILPVRDTVLFPGGVLPLTVGRESSLALLNSLEAREACWASSRSSIRASRSPLTSTCTASAPWPSSTRPSRCPTATWWFSWRGWSASGSWALVGLEAVPARPRRAGRRHRRSARHGTVGSGTQRAGAVPRRGGAFAATLRRSADRGAEYRRPGPAGRFHRRQPAVAFHAAAPGIAGNRRRPQAPGDPDPRALEGARGSGAAQQDSGAGAGASEPEPARIPAARADEGHSEGARRIRRSARPKSTSCARSSTNPACPPRPARSATAS